MNMKTLEDILTDYCGCFGPALNDRTGRFTSSGDEAYKYLKDFISSLGDLGVLNPDDTINRLDKISEQYMLGKIPDTIKLSVTEILKITKGKKLHTYDSWNGSSTGIIVDKVELLSDSAFFSGTNHWGGESGIYVDLRYLEELLDKGRSSKHNQIERCDVVTSWIIE